MLYSPSGLLWPVLGQTLALLVLVLVYFATFSFKLCNGRFVSNELERVRIGKFGDLFKVLPVYQDSRASSQDLNPSPPE